MKSAVQPIPPGYRSLTPHLTVDGGVRAIEFYAKAFGAREIYCFKCPDGDKVLNAALQIGDSLFMLNDPSPEMASIRSPSQVGHTTAVMHVYTEDSDALTTRAVAAGAQLVMPPTNMFWGDRYALVADPFGHVWAIATRVEEPTPQEMEQRFAALGA